MDYFTWYFTTVSAYSRTIAVHGTSFEVWELVTRVWKKTLTY